MCYSYIFYLLICKYQCIQLMGMKHAYPFSNTTRVNEGHWCHLNDDVATEHLDNDVIVSKVIMNEIYHVTNQVYY